MRKILSISLKGLAGLLLAALLLLMAWLASNNRWVDVGSDAVPQALLLPAPALPAERNGFFLLTGLDAPEGADPAALGRRRWAAVGPEPDDPDRLRWPQTLPGDPASSWNCRASDEDCVARWREQAPALRALMQRHAALGLRCEALVESGFVMDELLPKPSAELKVPADQYAARALAPVTGWTQCARWLRLQAVMAQQRGDQQGLREALQRSQTYVDGLLTGSRSLIGHALAWRIAADHWQMLAVLAALQPALAPELIKLAEPLPAEALDASRWMVTEAFVNRQITRELGQACELGGRPADAGGVVERALNCAAPGFMPRATQQLFDQHWAAAIDMARGGPLALLDWNPQPQGRRLFGLAWYNTVGHILFDVAAPNYPGYGRRQANLLLQHQAALLALRAASQPAAARADWLAAQPLDSRLRGRIRLEGAQIVASLWSDHDEAKPARYPIPSFQDS